MNFQSYFEGKKVTLMGLGVLGRGAGDAQFLAACGAELIVTDLKSRELLDESISRLASFPNITFVLGEHRLEDFEDRDIVLVAAGVPLDSPYVQHARTHSKKVAQSAALFAELSKIPIVGVTGTRGKSTTTLMIHHVLSVTTEGAPVLLGGNIRGVSNLQLLNDVTEDSIAVMELDSWQLQGFGWAGISPQIAVFTNFMEDHLNYYMQGGRDHDVAMDLYFKDKAQIFLHQEESGVFVTTPSVFERAQRLAGTIGQEVVLADASVLPEDMLLSMPGEHNRQNAALAYEALKAVGLTDEEIFEGLASFPGVPGRLEYLGEKDGVKMYNDNNATTPTATLRGVEALASTEEKKIILIAGGAYKEVDPSPFVTAGKKCKTMVLLPGTGTDALMPLLHTDAIPYILTEGSDGGAVIKNALETAVASAAPGDIILFSPGFASFGLFTNEYDRNDILVAAVDALLTGST